MEDFLSKLDQLIAEQDLSVIEIIGALELAKAELLNAVLTADAEDSDEACSHRRRPPAAQAA